MFRSTFASEEQPARLELKGREHLLELQKPLDSFNSATQLSTKNQIHQKYNHKRGRTNGRKSTLHYKVGMLALSNPT